MLLLSYIYSVLGCPEKRFLNEMYYYYYYYIVLLIYHRVHTKQYKQGSKVLLVNFNVVRMSLTTLD